MINNFLVPSPTSPMVRHRMTSMREAFRLRREAHMERRLWMFFLEHSMLEEAGRARAAVLDKLANASAQVRILLGIHARATGLSARRSLESRLQGPRPCERPKI